MICTVFVGYVWATTGAAVHSIAATRLHAATNPFRNLMIDLQSLGWYGKFETTESSVVAPPVDAS